MRLPPLKQQNSNFTFKNNLSSENSGFMILSTLLQKLCLSYDLYFQMNCLHIIIGKNAVSKGFQENLKFPFWDNSLNLKMDKINNDNKEKP